MRGNGRDLLVAAFIRAILTSGGAVLFFVAPSVLLHPSGITILERSLVLFLIFIGVAMVPLSYAEARLAETRPAALELAAAAFAAAVFVWIAVVTARLEAVYTVEAILGGGPRAALARLHVELQWMCRNGPPDGASPRVFGPATLAALHAARVPAFFAPPAGAIFALRAGPPRVFKYLLAVALLALGAAAIVPVADALPPFTYKYPGWNGTVQVIEYVLFAEIVGTIGLAAAAHLADRIAPHFARRGPPV